MSVQVGNLENVYLLKFLGDQSEVADKARELENDDHVREGLRTITACSRYPTANFSFPVGVGKIC